MAVSLFFFDGEKHHGRKIVFFLRYNTSHRAAAAACFISTFSLYGSPARFSIWKQWRNATTAKMEYKSMKKGKRIEEFFFHYVFLKFIPPTFLSRFFTSIFRLNFNSINVACLDDFSSWNWKGKKGKFEKFFMLKSLCFLMRREQMKFNRNKFLGN